jgi:hypothetical protein
MGITTIRVHKELKKEMRKLAIHPRETDEQILNRLLKDNYKIKANERRLNKNVRKKKD